MLEKTLKFLFKIFGHLRGGPYVGSAGLIKDGEKILLIKERLGYALPGGLVNYNEDPEEAVIREVREETGLTVSVKNLIDVYSKPSEEKISHSIVFLYECKIKEGIIKKSWEGEPVWVNINKLPDNMKHGYKEILEKYFKRG